MKSTAAVVFVLITGCGAMDNYEMGEHYSPTRPPDPTEAILAGQKAATRPSPPADVLVVPFPDKDRRPVDTGEMIIDEEETEQ
jgi:hypothetical protein